MEVKTSVKQNIVTRKGVYNILPYSCMKAQNGELFTSSRLFTFAALLSTAKISGGNAKISFSELQNKTTLSRVSVSNSIKSLTSNGAVAQIKHYHERAEYKLKDSLDASGAFIQFEEALKSEEFFIPIEQRARKLHNSEYILLSYIATVSKELRGKEFFNASIESLKNKLGRCGDTIKNALDVLISANLLISKDTYHRRKRSKQLRLRPRTWLISRMKNMARFERNEPQKLSVREEQDRAREFIAIRERYYNTLRNAAERATKPFIQALEADPEYIAADRKKRNFEIKLARAEYLNDIDAASEIKIKLRSVEAIRKKRMTLHGITEDDLLPKYRCRKCNDTGFLDTGQMCDCYPFQLSNDADTKKN